MRTRPENIDKATRRELIAPRGSKRYVLRDPRGRIKESDDVGRSLAKPGQGDRGDGRVSRTKAKKRRTRSASRS